MKKPRPTVSDGAKIYLSREEQVFLMEWLEMNDPVLAAERFAELMILEKADPIELQKYLKRVMKRLE